MSSLHATQFVQALNIHRAGGATHEETLLTLVQLLSVRPHLLCGLSMWVPADQVASSSQPAFVALRMGVNETLGRAPHVAVA